MSLLHTRKIKFRRRHIFAPPAQPTPTRALHTLPLLAFVAYEAFLGLPSLGQGIGRENTFHAALLGVLVYGIFVKVSFQRFAASLGISLFFYFGGTLLLRGMTSEVLDSNLATMILITASVAAFHWIKLGLLQKTAHMESVLFDSNTRLSDLSRETQILADNMSEGVYFYRLNSKNELEIDPLASPLFPEAPGSEISLLSSLDHLFSSSGFSREQIDAIHGVLTNSLGDTILYWDFHSKGLPREVRANLDHNPKTVNMTWEAIRGDDGVVQKILLLLHDVTELKLLHEDSKARSEDAKRLMELICNSPKKIGDFFTIAEAMITEGKKGNALTPENTRLNFHNIHTLKGMARGYQLVELTDCLEQLETAVLSTQEGENLSIIHLPAYQACEAALRSYKNLFLKAYTRPIYGNQVSTDAKVILDLTNQIETGLIRSDIESTFKALNEIRSIYAFTLDKLVIDEISMLRQLADELHKPHPNLYINELDIQLSETGKITLRKVFVHLFRNSIDHGIENDAERTAKGKAPRGQISIHTGKKHEIYRITYKDDGQGLNLPKILQKAVSLGLANLDRRYSPQETAELIFLPGVSTNAEPNMISGRGVGMDAIRSFLRQEGGNISIVLDPDSEGPYHNFSFVIDIPAKRGDQKLELLKRTG